LRRVGLCFVLGLDFTFSFCLAAPISVFSISLYLFIWCDPSYYLLENFTLLLYCHLNILIQNSSTSNEDVLLMQRPGNLLQVSPPTQKLIGELVHLLNRSTLSKLESIHPLTQPNILVLLSKKLQTLLFSVQGQ